MSLVKPFITSWVEKDRDGNQWLCELKVTRTGFSNIKAVLYLIHPSYNFDGEVTLITLKAEDPASLRKDLANVLKRLLKL